MVLLLPARSNSQELVLSVGRHDLALRQLLQGIDEASLTGVVYRSLQCRRAEFIELFNIASLHILLLAHMLGA